MKRRFQLIRLASHRCELAVLPLVKTALILPGSRHSWSQDGKVAA